MGIRRFILEYIQNLDIVLSDLEQVRVTIARTKSQFYQASIKIVGYIYDVDGCHSNTSKVLKIFYQPKYTDVILTCAFIEGCVYYQN